jgi:Ca2+-binding RTX toxin-like protein
MTILSDLWTRLTHKKRHRPEARRCRPGVEALEGREVPAVTWSVTSGILTIGGTPGNDAVMVTRQGGVLGVTVGTVSVMGGRAIGAAFVSSDWQAVRSPVSSVLFLGGEGHDAFVNGNEIPVTAYGLGGNDWLAGGLGNDTLLGGEGDDIVQGGPGAGHDLLVGGNGRDRLEGGPGNDTLVGGNHAYEYVYSKGAYHPVLVSVSDGVQDTLDGGPGQDTFYQHWYSHENPLVVFPVRDDRILDYTPGPEGDRTVYPPTYSLGIDLDLFP